MKRANNYDLEITILTTIASPSFNSVEKLVRDNYVKTFGNNAIYNIKLFKPSMMAGDTSHDKTLVDLINKAYIYDKETFGLIIETLAKRDEEECYDKEINVPLKDENGYYNYLSNVADDEDLKTIINFVRMIDVNNKMIFV